MLAIVINTTRTIGAHASALIASRHVHTISHHNTNSVVNLGGERTQHATAHRPRSSVSRRRATKHKPEQRKLIIQTLRHEQGRVAAARTSARHVHACRARQATHKRQESPAVAITLSIARPIMEVQVKIGEAV